MPEHVHFNITVHTSRVDPVEISTGTSASMRTIAMAQTHNGTTIQPLPKSCSLDAQGSAITTRRGVMGRCSLAGIHREGGAGYLALASRLCVLLKSSVAVARDFAINNRKTKTLFLHLHPSVARYTTRCQTNSVKQKCPLTQHVRQYTKIDVKSAHDNEGKLQDAYTARQPLTKPSSCSARQQRT